MGRAKNRLGSNHRKSVADKRKRANNPRPAARPRRTAAEQEREALTFFMQAFARTVNNMFQGSITKYLRSIDMLTEPNRSKARYWVSKVDQSTGKFTPRKSQKGQLRASAQADAIEEAVESLTFPFRTCEIQRAVLLGGRAIERYRIKKILKQRWGWVSKKMRKVANASAPKQCIKRTLEGMAMRERLDILNKEWTLRWNKNDKSFRWYYYDQCSINQHNLDDGESVGPAGVEAYATNRTSARSTSITLHLLIDQWGYGVHWLLAGPKKKQGKKAKEKAKKGKETSNKGTGQGQVNIEHFLWRAEAAIPRKQGNEAPWIFFDHLDSHVNIAKGKYKSDYGKRLKANYMLTPVTYPDANPIENCFRSLKAYLKKVLPRQTKTLSAKELIPVVAKHFKAWNVRQTRNDAMYQDSYRAVQEIIDAKGDLQVRMLKKKNYNSAAEVRLPKLPKPNAMTDSDDEESSD